MKKRTTILGLLLVFLFALTTSAAAAPAAPTNVGSTSHQVSISSTNNKVTVTWTASTGPDLNGYATLWDNSADTVPVTKTLGSTATSTTSPTLSDASNWYFHIRAIDDSGAYSSTVDLGPFIIDTQPNVSAISPSTAGNDSTTNVTITGTDFMSNATVLIGTADMTNVVFASSTELTATVPANLNAATYDIKVTNPTSAKSGTKSSAFTVTSSNTAPTIDAGNDSTVTVGTIAVTLSGTADDPDGDTMTYQWSVTSAPTGGSTTITSQTSLTGASFTPDEAGSYTIQLSVSDGTVSVTDTMTLTVNTANNATPIVDAGAAQSVVVEATVALAGTVTDSDQGDSWTYSWTITTRPTGSAASLTGSDTLTPSFTADKAGTYVISFTATDSASAVSSPDTVSIVANGQPTASAGTDQAVITGEVVTLDASGSSDPNAGTTLTYSWTFTSVDNNSEITNSQLSSTIAEKPTFTPDVDGDYVLTLTVDDGSGESNATDTDTVTVTASSNPPPVANAGPDQNVTYSDTPFSITVDGSGSTNLGPGDDTTSYSWQFTAVPTGSTYTTDTAVATTATHTFSTEVDVTGTYTLQLTVTDATPSSNTDTVDIIVASTSVDILLNTGWNLISLPLTPADTTPSVVLAGILSSYSKVYGFDNSTKQWKLYDPSGAQTLTAITSGKAYWIYITAESGATLNSTGSAASKTHTLASGWNFESYDGTDGTAIATAVTGLGVDYSKIYGFDNSTKAWKLYDPLGAQTLTTLGTGKGYWVYITHESGKTWEQ